MLSVIAGILLMRRAIGTRALNEADFRKELPAVGVPTLIVQGDADMSAPLALTGRKTASANR